MKMNLQNNLIFKIIFITIITIHFTKSQEVIQDDTPTQDNIMFMVIVSNSSDSRQYCVGTLISTTHVLTTNSCASIDNWPIITPVNIYLSNQYNNVDIASNSRTVIKKIHSKSSMDKLQFPKSDNIALLILNAPFHNKTNPILPITLYSGQIDLLNPDTHCYTINIIERLRAKRSLAEAVLPLVLENNITKESTSKFQNITERFPPTLQNITERFTSILQNITKEFPSVLQNVSEEFSSTLQNISEEFPSILQNIVKGSPSILNITEGLSSTLNNNTEEFSSTLQNITEEFSTMQNIMPSHNNITEKSQKLFSITEKSQIVENAFISISNYSKGLISELHTEFNNTIKQYASPIVKPIKYISESTMKENNKFLFKSTISSKPITTISNQNANQSANTSRFTDKGNFQKPISQLTVSSFDAKIVINEKTDCQSKELGIFETTVGKEDILFVCGQKFCKRDIGGPLVCNNQLVGIMSACSENCEAPYVYKNITKIAMFLSCAHEYESCHRDGCKDICTEKNLNENLDTEEARDSVKMVNASLDIVEPQFDKKKNRKKKKYSKFHADQNNTQESSIFDVEYVKGKPFDSKTEENQQLQSKRNRETVMSDDEDYALDFRDSSANNYTPYLILISLLSVVLISCPQHKVVIINY